MVDPKLHDFLKENDTGLYQRIGQQVIAYVHIYFCDLSDFVEIVGQNWFDEGGREVQMFDKTICVELSGLLDISDYKNCFDDYEYYFKESQEG